MLFSNFGNSGKNTAPVQVVHTTLMAFRKFFTASDEHRMITHTRGRARTYVYAQHLQRFITRNFSSQSSRILKTEPVQHRNRFRRIRYSEMDIPISELSF